MSPLSIIFLPVKKFFFSKSGEKYAKIKHCLQAKTVLNGCKQLCRWILMWGQQEMDFFTGGSTGILCTGSLAGSNGLKIKRLNDGLVCYKLATFHFKRCKLMDWSCVDYFWIIVMFLSAVWTLILTAPIRGATDRRWSVIRTDQSPRFGTHVIRGLTDKFNHHRVKVYHLHALSFLRSAAAAHAEARTRRERAWEREAWFRYRVSDNASTDGYIHTHKVMLKYPFWQVFW